MIESCNKCGFLYCFISQFLKDLDMDDFDCIAIRIVICS